MQTHSLMVSRMGKMDTEKAQRKQMEGLWNRFTKRYEDIPDCLHDANELAIGLHAYNAMLLPVFVLIIESHASYAHCMYCMYCMYAHCMRTVCMYYMHTLRCVHKLHCMQMLQVCRC